MSRVALIARGSLLCKRDDTREPCGLQVRRQVMTRVGAQLEQAITASWPPILSLSQSSLNCHLCNLLLQLRPRTCPLPPSLS